MDGWMDGGKISHLELEGQGPSIHAAAAMQADKALFSTQNFFIHLI